MCIARKFMTSSFCWRFVTAYSKFYGWMTFFRFKIAIFSVKKGLTFKLIAIFFLVNNLAVPMTIVCQDFSMKSCSKHSHRLNPAFEWAALSKQKASGMSYLFSSVKITLSDRAWKCSKAHISWWKNYSRYIIESQGFQNNF